MNHAKQQQLLQGQSGVALKVFDQTPIQEAWSVIQIREALRKAGTSSAEAHVVRACLGQLQDQGLVRQPRKDVFQRVEISKPPADLKVVKTVPQSTAVATPVEPTNSLTLLADLSSELVSLSTDFSTRIKALANRIDEAALVIEQEREANAGKMATVTQLAALLKGLA